ncbi:unnamed protein product [Didymodactylos carnosus]|uniref:Glycosyltransferase 61 catalytic domain-containing protein n=1 Tax=Didymodactylos carnosus TaxID=1234261 RepID=A0A8S2P3E4_9BILA|nr:unnamed protein product [Didymodactylos carnosus]CAF4033584.1 unnamed protein product [Didymodactylos carnosus]
MFSNLEQITVERTYSDEDEPKKLPQISIPYFRSRLNSSRRYSKFRCAGNDNHLRSWQQRVCVFNNICYNVNNQHFEYYRYPQIQPKPVFFDAAKRMLTEFSPNGDGKGFVLYSISRTPRWVFTWAPFMIDTAVPTENVTRLSNLHTLWKVSTNDYNIGHMIWEDFFMIYYAMERMQEFDDSIVIMHADKIPSHPLFKKLQKEILSALTPHPIVEQKTYLSSFKTRYVCFNRFIIGGSILLYQPRNTVIHHRDVESLLFNWRTMIIHHFKLDPKYIPTKHRITISNKTDSAWTRVARRNIANLNDIVKFVKQTYPTIEVNVVVWQKLSFREQVDIMLKTTIFITPSGGVSMMAPFLPIGAHIITPDFLSDRDMPGFKKGESVALEGNFWAYWPHVHKDYYQIFSRKEQVWDFANAAYSRDEASVIMNTTRLGMLIDKALEDMSP